MAAGDQIPWSYIAKRVGEAELTADSTTWNATESGTLMSASPTLVSGFKYKVFVFVVVSTDVAADTAGMRLREDTASGTQMQLAPIYLPTTSANGFALAAYAEYTAVANGAKTFVLTGQRTTGTGTAHRIRASSSRKAYMHVDLVLT